MAKRRKEHDPSRRAHSGPSRKVRTSANGGAETTPAGRDRLGKLLEGYGVTLAGVLSVSLLLGLVGTAVAGWGILQQPRSITVMIVGGAILLVAVALLAVNLCNVGKRFDVRKQGIRFISGTDVTEFAWDEIADVGVDRLDDTYVGVANVRRRSDDVHSPSGLLTKTEWTIVILAHDGRQIRVGPVFMRTVNDPKGLIANVRLRAGLM